MPLDPRKFTQRFVEEARERLAGLVEGIRSFEGGGEEGPALIDGMFRAVHTVKGSAKMLGQSGIGETAHRLEDLLDALRGGRVEGTPDLTRALFRGADALAALVERLAAGEERPPADEEAIAVLAAFLGSSENEAEPKVLPAEPEPTPPQAPREEPPQPVASHIAESVRVRVEKLDDLIRLAGEGLAARARAASRVDELGEIEHMAFPAGADAAERLRMLRDRIGQFRRSLRADFLAREAIDAELQGAALAMRMLPLSIVFEPAARMAREIARSLGKELDCVVSGAELELDRQIIDRLGEPVLHLLRNAIDHGVEEPARRSAAGKPPRGRIELTARQAEGAVVVEVRDDGGGLPIEAIRQKAVRIRAVAAEKAASLSAREIADLVFLPGFSTSPLVTDLSGRGVGLDVVRKTVVDELKGNVTVDSTPGKGCTFSLRLPSTLAVMRVLFARAGREIFCFASHDVAGIVDVEEGEIIDLVGGRAAVIRDEFVPIIGLAETLGAPEGAAKPGPRKGLRLVVVNDGSERLALAIDELVDERDAVVKPLPSHMRSASLVSGIVATGENELICLLNAPSLLRRSRAARGSGARREAVRQEEGPVEILIVDDSLNTREIERDVLEAHGYSITLAVDGFDGLEKARERRFDAVLTDVEMPRMDGFTLTERLRAEESYRDTPIVNLTSRSRDEDRKRGIKAGADAYIVKGDFEQGSLLETLRGLGL